MVQLQVPAAKKSEAIALIEQAEAHKGMKEIAREHLAGTNGFRAKEIPIHMPFYRKVAKSFDGYRARDKFLVLFAFKTMLLGIMMMFMALLFFSSRHAAIARQNNIDEFGSFFFADDEIGPMSLENSTDAQLEILDKMLIEWLDATCAEKKRRLDLTQVNFQEKFFQILPANPFTNVFPSLINTRAVKKPIATKTVAKKKAQSEKKILVDEKTDIGIKNKTEDVEAKKFSEDKKKMLNYFPLG